ncbi:MAG: hypothetical protein K8T91_17845 [Planctomycetes bacterium]|nr:hypothetical protein [Planctomycetota bacterium]
MTELPNERTWQQTIDRLVDGELSETDSRELLAMLDGVDGGWRRLALAYVEAQWLRGELPSLVHAGQEAETNRVPGASLGPAAVGLAPPQTNGRATVNGTRYPRFALMAMAVAASMLVAFGLTLWQRGIGVTTPPGPTAPVVSAEQSGISKPQLAKLPNDAPAIVGIPASDVASPRSNDKNNISSPSVASQKSSLEPRMVVIGSDEELRGQDTTTVPPQVIEALRRMGHRVDQRSGVMPVRLKDGRSVDVPYDQVDVQYRGGSSFQ